MHPLLPPSAPPSGLFHRKQTISPASQLGRALWTCEKGVNVIKFKHASQVIRRRREPRKSMLVLLLAFPAHVTGWHLVSRQTLGEIRNLAWGFGKEQTFSVCLSLWPILFRSLSSLRLPTPPPPVPSLSSLRPPPSSSSPFSDTFSSPLSLSVCLSVSRRSPST